jgi:glycine/D-amino acid oxidase-like deaminating enzyme
VAAGMGALAFAQSWMSWPAKIVIVGGGTAGWLAALMLGDSAKRADAPCDITVIESSKIGTIGVGEGTTAVFRQMLQHFKLDEMAFLRETGATIKFGIRHRDWRHVGHSYDGPIDDPHQVAGTGHGAFLDQYQVSQGEGVSETHLFQHLMRRSKSPYAMKNGKVIPVGPFQHAYHFDQALAGQFLRRAASGVTIIDDQVTEVVRDGESGDISAIKLEGGADIRADLFIDCTGFRRALISKMGAQWISYSDVLPVNRAMPFWIDIKDGEEIDPVTLAWAQSSGWLWKIPTQERYGCGYVYSDAHLTPDQAKAEIEAKLGQEIHPRNDIKIDAGRLDKVWINNCVAIGLASSFLEPLEATSIHGTIVQLMLLTGLLRDATERSRLAYNGTVAGQVDDFRDFIRLHYVTMRRDSPFWNDVAATTPDSITKRVAHWANHVPSSDDFPPFPMGLPHVTHHLHTPVLDGLGLLNAKPARDWLAARPDLRKHARKTAADLQKEYKLAAGKAIGHREFLQSLHGA